MRQNTTLVTTTGNSSLPGIKQADCHVDRVMIMKANRFLRVFSQAIFLFISIQLFPAQAIEFQTVYQSKVLIEDQTEKARKEAQALALKRVLVKATGSTAVLTDKTLKKEIKRADQFLSQYQFGSTAGGQQVLDAQFDPVKINQLIRRQGLKLWGTRRPLTMIWMATEIDEQREIVTPERSRYIAEQINSLPETRGLPVILPLMDLDDASRIQVSDIWGRFFGHVYQASERYQPEAIVLARLSPLNKEQWQLDWTVYEGETEKKRQVNEGDYESIVQLFLNELADYFAQQYAIDVDANASNSGLVVNISGVAAIEDFINAENRLLSLSSVLDAQLVSVHNGYATFSVSLIGEAPDLIDALDLDPQFKKIFDPLIKHQETQPLEYRWQG